MVQTFKEWIELLVHEGLLCDAYQEKLKHAHSKASIMDVCLDANGISFLCEMEEKGYGIPHEILKRDFWRYFNGKYISQRMKNGHPTYSGSIYCDDDSDSTLCATCTSFLGCVKNVFVKENDFVRICADKNSILTVYCPKSSRCLIECYGSATIIDANKFNNLTIKYI